MQKALFTSLRQDWKTPKDFYKKLNEEFRFDFDPCVNNYLRFIRKIYGKSDGLTCEWGGGEFCEPTL